MIREYTESYISRTHVIISNIQKIIYTKNTKDYIKIIRDCICQESTWLYQGFMRLGIYTKSICDCIYQKYTKSYMPRARVIMPRIHEIIPRIRDCIKNIKFAKNRNVSYFPSFRVCFNISKTKIWEINMWSEVEFEIGK